jgi:hypothetical protein
MSGKIVRLSGIFSILKGPRGAVSDSIIERKGFTTPQCLHHTDFLDTFDGLPRHRVVAGRDKPRHYSLGEIHRETVLSNITASLVRNAGLTSSQSLRGSFSRHPVAAQSARSSSWFQ